MIFKNNSNKFYAYFLFVIFFGNPFLIFFAEEIKWDLDANNKFKKNNKLKWEKYYPEKISEESENEFLKYKFQKDSKINNYFVSENNEVKTNEFLYLGFAVPNSYVMHKKDFMIYADQQFPYYKSVCLN